MQRYKEEIKEEKVVKGIILEFLDFLRYKIENGSLTVGELEELFRLFISGCSNLCGTIEDFSHFYSQPKTNIRSVISRKVSAKPRRRVLYPFSAFQKAVPEKWRNSSNEETDSQKECDK